MLLQGRYMICSRSCSRCLLPWRLLQLEIVQHLTQQVGAVTNRLIAGLLTAEWQQLLDRLDH